MTAEALSVAGSHDFWVPAFELRIDDRTAEPTVVHDVIDVSYTDDLEKRDIFDITLNNWDAQTRQFKYVDDHRFDPGRQVTLAMGYRDAGRLQPMISGEITSMSPDFPAGGQPTIKISGLGLLDRFCTEQRSEVYEGRTDSQIAQDIAARLGIDIQVAPRDERPHPYLLQEAEYDVVFLMQRARRIDYDLIVEEGDGTPRERLYFGPTQNRDRPTYELSWGHSLIDFRPSLNTANQVDRVTVRAVDPVKRRLIEATVTRADIDVTGLGRAREAAAESAFKERTEVITRPVRDEAEARREAQAALQRIAKGMVTARGSTIGVPELRAGTVVQIAGVGERFSGRYLITSSTHTIGGNGYTTSFDCRREELS